MDRAGERNGWIQSVLERIEVVKIKSASTYAPETNGRAERLVYERILR